MKNIGKITKEDTIETQSESLSTKFECFGGKFRITLLLYRHYLLLKENFRNS
jgi:hypothetical protein